MSQIEHIFKKFKMAFDRGVHFGNFIDRVADLHGDKTCFILDTSLDYSFMRGDRHSYVEWLGFVNRMANVLKHEIGIRAGDRVIVDMSNRIEIPFTCAAIMKIGAVAIPLNFMLTSGEIAYIASDSGARFFIVDRNVFASRIVSQERIPVVEKWMVLDGSTGLGEGMIELKPLLDEASPEFPPQRKDPDELVGIFYTSGTTGFPKGAMMSSKSLLAAQRMTAAVVPTTTRDIGAMALPLAHLFGFGLWIIALSGGLTGLFVRSFNPKKMLEIIEKMKPTIFVGAPAMYLMMLDVGIDKYDLSHVRIWGSSSDAMPDEVAKIFCRAGGLYIGGKRFPSIFLDAYGMVELSALACLKIQLPGINFPTGCVGWPMPPIRMRVIDDEGNKLPAGSVGELAVKGPCVTLGYWGKPEETKAAMSNGWFRTGDMAKKDRLGRVYFVDRKKDVIKSGGYSVFSVEVEKEILAHPGISDVGVVGVPHPTLKEVPIAVVVLEPNARHTAEEILKWCESNIASYKCPRKVIIIPEEEMPRTPTMKILKRELREKYRDLFLQPDGTCSGKS